MDRRAPSGVWRRTVVEVVGREPGAGDDEVLLLALAGHAQVAFDPPWWFSICV